jgi:hypothetical protein
MRVCLLTAAPQATSVRVPGAPAHVALALPALLPIRAHQQGAGVRLVHNPVRALLTRAAPPRTSQLTIARRATAFTAFLFLGFLEIGQEIENPFEYAENDLDLDGICMGIQRELAEVTAHTCPEPDAYVFTAWNQPFAPADRRTAQEIVEDAAHDYHDRTAGLAHMRRTLLKSWRQVDNQTRLHYEVDAPITPA